MRGKPLKCPRVILVPAKDPKFLTRQDAWVIVGPIIARIIAAVIQHAEETKQLSRGKRRKQKTKGEYND